MMDDLDEILDSAQVPNPDNPRHVEAMLALLRCGYEEDARAVCAQAQREGRSFRQLATLAEWALVIGSEWAYSRWDRFLRRAFGNDRAER